jgi:hypothetical protein
MNTYPIPQDSKRLFHEEFHSMQRFSKAYRRTRTCRIVPAVGEGKDRCRTGSSERAIRSLWPAKLLRVMATNLSLPLWVPRLSV